MLFSHLQGNLCNQNNNQTTWAGRTKDFLNGTSATSIAAHWGVRTRKEYLLLSRTTLHLKLTSVTQFITCRPTRAGVLWPFGPSHQSTLYTLCMAPDTKTRFRELTAGVHAWFSWPSLRLQIPTAEQYVTNWVLVLYLVPLAFYVQSWIWPLALNQPCPADRQTRYLQMPHGGQALRVVVEQSKHIDLQCRRFYLTPPFLR